MTKEFFIKDKKLLKDIECACSGERSFFIIIKNLVFSVVIIDLNGETCIKIRSYVTNSKLAKVIWCNDLTNQNNLSSPILKLSLDEPDKCIYKSFIFLSSFFVNKKEKNLNEIKIDDENVLIANDCGGLQSSDIPYNALVKKKKEYKSFLKFMLKSIYGDDIFLNKNDEKSLVFFFPKNKTVVQFKISKLLIFQYLKNHFIIKSCSTLKGIHGIVLGNISNLQYVDKFYTGKGVDDTLESIVKNKAKFILKSEEKKKEFFPICPSVIEGLSSPLEEKELESLKEINKNLFDRFYLKRPSKRFIAMQMAYIQSTLSTCRKMKVGAVLVDSSYAVISSGYNGVPSGFPHCCDEHSETHSALFEIHAEQNVLGKCGWVPKDNNDYSIMFITHKPCIRCAQTIMANAKRLRIKEIVYKEEFTDVDYEYDKYKEHSDEVKDFLKKGGICLTHYTS